MAERLERVEQPVHVCGVARVRELLTDGAGPLYGANAEMPICEAVWWVADGLDGADELPVADGSRRCARHAWGCPVIMKLDPTHVAWTCERCGAIATSADQTVRPT